MAEPVQLIITAQDLASPTLGQVQQSLQALPGAAQAAEGGILGFSTQVSAAWNNAGQLQQAITQGQAVLAQLGATAQGQASPAFQNFSAVVESARGRLAELQQAGQQAQSGFQGAAQGAQGAGAGTQQLAHILTMTQEQIQRMTQELGGGGGGGATGLLTLFGSTALQTAAAIVGVHSAVSTLSTIIRTGVADIGSFDAAMRENYTLGIRSMEVQAQLRDQVLQLPPALGSSTDLAKGLYQTLSSGIEPGKAVEFVGVAATLATTGLASMDTTVEALTKTMHAYQIPTERANEVSEILFKTVFYGQGRLQRMFTPQSKPPYPDKSMNFLVFSPFWQLCSGDYRDLPLGEYVR